MNNMWVRQYRYESAFDPKPLENAWWIFDPTGIWLGTVHTPERFTLMDVTRNHIVGVFRDEADVEHVRLYRLNKNERQ